MKPSHLTQALRGLIPQQLPLHIWGPPGVGKSKVVAQAAWHLGLNMIDLRAVLLDPVDLRGLPKVENG
ncbi:MAG: MoxR family ATPase, partial [Acidobacteriota bacterium]|nr:MoxR family ATPase [Acidobacteriota bacterium]